MAQLAPEGALPIDGRLLAHGLPLGVELLSVTAECTRENPVPYETTTLLLSQYTSSVS